MIRRRNGKSYHAAVAHEPSLKIVFGSHRKPNLTSGSNGSKRAVLHEPCARLVARMFTFQARKIA
ncbi:hypothetical protein GOC90_28640 [Sinorhizobium medicae]|nr:hypothetical protein [Sinorhizobium meliloti]MDX0549720.1 hypothetical protein [Sinorhizobium medicae]MDX0562045.1 hypothetical protein [Sinorhizobium medicae]MDX0599315.1 hypothetical protein [Sinorhizobium medicae]MDX0611362.1 hypothetical protein [Sinorhizobium medicae]